MVEIGAPFASVAVVVEHPVLLVSPPPQAVSAAAVPKRIRTATDLANLGELVSDGKAGFFIFL